MNLEVGHMRIGADWRGGRQQLESIDPYSGAAWALVPEATDQDVDDAVTAARSAFTKWKRVPGADRAALLHRLADLIEENASDLALCETRDNGKLLRETTDQMRMLPAWYRYFAGLCDKSDGRVVETGRPNYFGYVTKVPLGVVAAVLPWNSPLLLLTFKAAPALAAGCVMVVKPSEVAPMSVLRFAELFDKAGFPAGVFNTVTGGGAVGQHLVNSPGVDRIDFTGSTQTGRAVASAAGRHLASYGLELGGKSPNIVFPDADPAEAANGLMAGIFAAAGQTCIAGSRGLLQREVQADITERIVERAQTIRMGDPQDPATELGPIAFPGHIDAIESYVQSAIADGGHVVTGGRRASAGDLFYEPTIIAGLPNSARVCREEIFGPVLALLPFSDEDEAIAIANDSDYGLAAGVWTSDLRRAFRMVEALDVGTVWVNGYRTLTWSMPFGGMKQSGVGRENGQESIQDYLVDKTVWIETQGLTRDPFTVG